MLERIKNIIRDHNTELGIDIIDNDHFSIEIYADYRDEISDETVTSILESDDNQNSFYEAIFNMYMDYAEELRCNAIESIICLLQDDDADNFDEDEIRDICCELISIELPYDHFLDQTFHVPIMLDTGDGNYDFSMNSLYPCWYGEANTEIDETSSLLWLANQQGYTELQLRSALAQGDLANPHGFLETVRQECANLTSSMSTVTFLVNMTLRDLMTLNECISLQDINGHNFDARKNPDCGYIMINKKTVCGLFDPWSGGGSVLEIELEKDVKLPIKFIFSAIPDLNRHNGRYGVDSTYGLCSKVWSYGGVDQIHVPDNNT